MIFFAFVYTMDHVNKFSFIKPTLHPWNEAYLILVNDGFDVFLEGPSMAALQKTHQVAERVRCRCLCPTLMDRISWPLLLN